MTIAFRRALLLSALAAPLLARGAAAAFPDRPMTLIMPYSPGTVAGAYARVIAEYFQRELGQPTVVSHRDGASGTVGMRALAQSPADGHSFAITPLTPVVVQPHMVRNLGIGPESFAPVCGVAENVLGVVVKGDSPIRDLQGLLEAGRRRVLTYGSPGPNSLPMLGVWRMQRAAGLEMTHVPFRGDSAPITEVMAGRLDFGAVVVASATPQIISNDLRLIGVFSDRRHPDYPDVPTAMEQGVGALQLSYVGMFAPRGTPDEVLNQLEQKTKAALETEAFRSVAQRGRVVVAFQPRLAFTELVQREYLAFGRILRELGVEPE